MVPLLDNVMGLQSLDGGKKSHRSHDEEGELIYHHKLEF